MIKNKKKLVSLLAIGIMVHHGCVIGQDTFPAVHSSLESVNQENSTRLITAIEDLPIVDMDSDELTFFNESLYSDDNSIELFQPVKISYFQQKLRAFGIMLLLKYIEAKEVLTHTYEKMRRMLYQILFRL